MKAALYIRLSKEDDHDGPSQSVTNQKNLLTGYAAKHAIPVYDIYIDDGWSGGNFDRPAFRRLLTDIENGKVDTVITKDLSRLGRDYILTGHYLERYFPEHRVRYISLLDDIDTAADGYTNDLTPFRAIINDMYARDISKKITSVKRDKQRRGQFIGGKAVYGYRKHPSDKNKLIIDEEAGEIVRGIFAAALGGASCREIADDLNRRAVPSPSVYAGLRTSQTLWSGERIAEMLQNETYIGNMVQGKRIKISYKSPTCLRQSREDWIIVENTHPPLIERCDFDAVQRLITSRSRTRRRTYDVPLKGMVFCRECGQPMGIVNRRGKSGEDTLYFICRTYRQMKKRDMCSAHCIKVKTVSEALSEAIAAYFEESFSRDRLLTAAREAIRIRHSTSLPQRSETNDRQRLQRLNSQLDRLYGDHLSGTIDENDFRRIYDKLRQERDTVRNAIRTPVSSPIPPIHPESLLRSFFEQSCACRAALCAVLCRVEITADKRIIITLPFPKPQTQPGEDRKAEKRN